ncbi:hypothetical protein C8F04DRAFT_1255643 [Mycena alexandri]|uniref:Uncharacterized protein n=1 Tax=Mycena alexandri TaxID=1745969 RepID=A0AAD6X6S9_9AGAR|nr:hypothetical protein C8F04DRAFT_1255643 [Mycena alexandri]
MASQSLLGLLPLDRTIPPQFEDFLSTIQIENLAHGQDLATNARDSGSPMNQHTDESDRSVNAMAEIEHSEYEPRSDFSRSFYELNLKIPPVVFADVPASAKQNLAIPPPGVVDAPPESDGVNLLHNRNETAVLGPYDGKVAAHVWVSHNRCFITSNAEYVPAPASAASDKLLLRRDMRWGPDDPTLWPHEYTDHYAHFGAIRRRPSTAEGVEKLWILWWDPDHTDFTSPASGQTITRGLGKLSSAKFSALSHLSNDLIQKSDDYIKCSNPSSQPLPLVMQLADSLRRGLSRLSSIPATFERMVLGVTNVQRTYLELEGLLQYMTIYKPRMEDRNCVGGPPDADTVGVFTSDPTVAEKFHRAKLPFWYMRPLRAFHRENILRVVQPLDPAGSMELEVVEGFAPIIVGPTLQERIGGLHRGTDTLPWYKNPFASGDTAKPLVVRSKPDPGSAMAGAVPVGLQPGPSSGSSTRNGKSRNDPYRRHSLKVPNPNAQQERNKYEVFNSPYMAPSIPGWEAALAAVDRSQPPACGWDPRNLYVLPEPALLISSEARLHTYLHHYQLIRDALMFRMADPNDHHTALTVSEWRDVLQGKVMKQGRSGTLAEKRTATIERVLGPAMRACGIDELDGIPVPADRVPLTTRTRSKEITWEVAEMGFRFELCALDGVASGLDRIEKCMQCFPGPLVGPDLSEGKKGFAAISSQDRLPFLLRLARLMLAWSYRPRPEELEGAEGYETMGWSPIRIAGFEERVARYYTQTFYHFFGRAAVIPLRLEHELGTHAVEFRPM